MAPTQKGASPGRKRYCGLGNHHLSPANRTISDPGTLKFAQYVNLEMRSNTKVCEKCYDVLLKIYKVKMRSKKKKLNSKKQGANSISDVSNSQAQMSHTSTSASAYSQESVFSNTASTTDKAESSTAKRTRADLEAQTSVYDFDDEPALSLNAVNGTRLPNIQPIPKRRQFVHNVMGCITSTNKLHELRQDNVFRVRVAHLQPSGPEASIIRSGYLELTPRELIFLTPGCEPIVWALQHLRRYGLNGDLFSFEAGRRCMSGPGIYTFRIHNAEQLYPMFQRYINAVNTDAFAQVERERERVNSTHSVSVLMGRSDLQPHSNNYLEPAPLLARAALQTQQQTNELTALPTDSPDSLPNLQLVAGEPLTANNATAALQSPITPGAYINTNTNVYFDQPLQRLLQEQNSHSTPSEATPTSSSSAFSTMRRPQQKQALTADLPPLESAPAVNETLRLYANVETPRERLLFEMPSGLASGNDRCYENISRLDLPLLPRDCSQQSVNSATLQQQQQQPPLTPTSLPGVNYIVLDLDQPRSPAQCSPKTMCNGFGSGLSLTVAAPVTPDGVSAAEVPPSAQNRSQAAVTSTGSGSTATPEPVGTQGYSTIDFIRTYALNKSSTATPHDGEIAMMCQHHHQDHAHEDGELRITRHSKCVRKAYSISE